MSQSLGCFRLMSFDRAARVFVVVVLGLLAAVAHPQPNPLDRSTGNTGQGTGGAGVPNVPGGGGLLGGGVVAGQAMTVPAFVKPGARLWFYGGDSTEPNDPQQSVSAGAGMWRYDVVAVLPDRVLLQSSLYLDAMGNRQQFTFSSGTPVVFDAMQVAGGGALWMPVDQLAALQPDQNIQITRGPWPLGGQSYDATSITILGNDSKFRYVFDAGTGLKLSEQVAVGRFRRNGGQNDGFNRQTQSFKSFEAFRQMDFPWLRHAPPAWTQTVNRLHYRGSYAMVIPGSPPMPIGLSATFEVQQRGEGWAAGTLTRSMDNVMGGPPNPPEQIPFVEGPGKALGLWMSPAALAELGPGVVDRDETLKNTLTYQVQAGPAGQLGVFVETNDTQTYTLVAGYDLQDGALSYAQFSDHATNVIVELQLIGRE